MGWPDLVVVHSDVELIVELEGLAPDHAAAPEGVAAVPELCLSCHIQDVFPAGQWPHTLPCATQESEYSHHTTCMAVPSLPAPHLCRSPRRACIPPKPLDSAAPSHSTAPRSHPEPPGHRDSVGHCHIPLLCSGPPNGPALRPIPVVICFSTAGTAKGCSPTTITPFGCPELRCHRNLGVH